MIGWLRLSLLGIDPIEVTFRRRGFRASSPEIRVHLETIGMTFLHGYHTALAEAETCRIGTLLNGVDVPLKGFAFEGAAMALALLDGLGMSSGVRLRCFAQGSGAPHRYMVHVGAGWALARLPWSVRRSLLRMDPLLCWLAIDGYGFHEGFFHSMRLASGPPAPRCISGYGRRAFDQGVGRSLWFVHGADALSIAKAIAAFDVDRHADLWSGVGLAACYAGGGGITALDALVSQARGHLDHLAQGAAFAAAARCTAENLTDDSARACERLCRAAPARVAALVETERPALCAFDDGRAYEAWRARVRSGLRCIKAGTPVADTPFNDRLPAVKA